MYMENYDQKKNQMLGVTIFMVSKPLICHYIWVGGLVGVEFAIGWQKQLCFNSFCIIFVVQFYGLLGRVTRQIVSMKI